MLAPALLLSACPGTWHTQAPLTPARGRAAIPVAGGTHEESQQVVDEVGEEHGGDGAPWDGVARTLQVPCRQERGALVPAGTAPSSLGSQSWCHPAQHTLPVPDMLEPAMMPVQPLNITAKTELKLIICPVV